MALVFLIVFIVNILLIFSMTFLERKRPETIISWLVLFTYLPIIGFLIYILIGSGLSLKNRNMLKRKQHFEKHYSKFVQADVSEDGSLTRAQKEIVSYNLNATDNPVFFGNDVKVFTNGPDKLKALLEDIEKAKKSINMEYYIFDDDETGKIVMEALCKKAREGVKVKLIYDSVGSLRAKRMFFRKLVKAGGEVEEFFPPLFHIRLINFKMNYRNHRKIAVIDGKIGYTGGINIRNDHMGKKKRLSPWRDTHVRIVGSAVYGLQNVFFKDWFFCKKQECDSSFLVSEGYFPKVKKSGGIAAQVITSGPETKEQYIKEAFIKMISLAKKSIIIESPYFIPDDIFMSAVKRAVLSGVKVKVIIPKKPDKKIVYLATLSYARELVEMGAEVYMYRGFIHSKMLVIDDTAVSIGTCNTDNRSFALNFEVTTIFLNQQFVNYCAGICEGDLAFSSKTDLEYFKKKPLFNRFGQVIFRMFSPLL